MPLAERPRWLELVWSDGYIERVRVDRVHGVQMAGTDPDGDSVLLIDGYPSLRLPVPYKRVCEAVRIAFDSRAGEVLELGHPRHPVGSGGVVVSTSPMGSSATIGEDHIDA